MANVTQQKHLTAAVTGAGSGLGREIALGLAAKNYRVFGTALSPREIDDLKSASDGAVNVRPGFNGYWLQQTTDHRINDVANPDSKERTVGLGPGIQVGGQGVWFQLNGYLETDVRNCPSGVKVTMRISKAVPAKVN